MNFKDYFSKQASEYTKYRPHYPEALYEYLATLVHSRQRAWDCATGSGQAALGLTPYFEQIIATDASKKQIANAIEHSKISYVVAPAEKTAIESASIDLIVVAQALHWFDLKVVGPFWPPERKFVDDKYQSIPFPFEELDVPQFIMESKSSLERLIGYLGTWSAVQRYKEKNRADPVESFAEELKLLWGQPQAEKQIRWPINMRVGRVE
jgi:hypothetical protein